MPIVSVQDSPDKISDEASCTVDGLIDALKRTREVYGGDTQVVIQIKGVNDAVLEIDAVIIIQEADSETLQPIAKPRYIGFLVDPTDLIRL